MVYLHVLLYCAPGLAFAGLATALGRAARLAIDAARGTEPVWARRGARLAVGMLGGAGLVLLLLGGVLSAIALRAWP